MYIQNRRDSSKFKGCSPLQICNVLISLKPAIAYFAYTNRSLQAKKPTAQTAHLVFADTNSNASKKPKELFLAIAPKKQQRK